MEFNWILTLGKGLIGSKEVVQKFEQYFSYKNCLDSLQDIAEVDDNLPELQK